MKATIKVKKLCFVPSEAGIKWDGDISIDGVLAKFFTKEEGFAITDQEARVLSRIIARIEGRKVDDEPVPEVAVDAGGEGEP